MNTKTLMALVFLFVTAISTCPPDQAMAGIDVSMLLEVDQNQNHLADSLEDSIAVLIAEGKGESSLRIVALLHSSPGKQDTDLLKNHGGTVTHRFHRVIDGLAGTVPASALDALASEWGDKLALIEIDGELQLAMDTSVQQTRARPLVWDARPNGYGVTGSASTTIAILDSGIDDTHPDLADKLVFWHDFHETAEPEPMDNNGHGTFVAGIALGSGASMGGEPISHLPFTFRSPIGSNMFYKRGQWIPVVGDGVVTMDMIWSVDGEFCLGLGPFGLPIDGPYCATGTSNYVVFNITEAGNYSILYDGGIIGAGCESSNTITIPYEQIGDGYNLFRGMAPDCNLAGFKVVNDWGNNAGFVSAAIAAMDSLAGCNNQYGIKVASMSAGVTFSSSLRMAAENVPTYGTVMVGITHNNYPDFIGDPGRAPNIITVGAVNEYGLLTDYTSIGRDTTPYKPDVLAPGGTRPLHGTGLMGIDTNDSDGYYDLSYPDRVPNDYCNNASGTSYAAPHVAGLVALVIDALESTGSAWAYTLQEAHLVKNIILLTATETNKPREDNYALYNPTLDRGGKDRFEGYGIINADAAIEAVFNQMPGDALNVAITFGDNPNDRRCWATSLSSLHGNAEINLSVPSTLDADLYIYEPNYDDGDPILVASSINSMPGDDESIAFEPIEGREYFLTVKRIDGFGEAVLDVYFPSLSNVVDATAPQLVDIYPNPFNPRTTIKFNVGRKGSVQISVYDVAGHQIAVLEDQVFEEGLRQVVWNGCDKFGSAVASGPYFVQIKSELGVEQKKIMLVR